MQGLGVAALGCRARGCRRGVAGVRGCRRGFGSVAAAGVRGLQMQGGSLPRQLGSGFADAGSWSGFGGSASAGGFGFASELGVAEGGEAAIYPAPRKAFAAKR